MKRPSNPRVTGRLLLLLAALGLAPACTPAEAKVVNYGSKPTIGNCASDPRVSGYQGAIGITCANAGGTAAYVKFGTGSTDWIAFPGNATVTTVSVDATDVDVTGLNGNIDGDYRLTGYVIFANSATGTLKLKPNNITANQVGVLTSVVTAQSPSTSGLVDFILTAFTGDASGTPSFFFQARLSSLTGRPRRLFWGGQDFTGVTTRRKLDGTGLWSDTTTNITSFRYSMTGASALIKAGSFFITEPLGTHSFRDVTPIDKYRRRPGRAPLAPSRMAA